MMVKRVYIFFLQATPLNLKRKKDLVTMLNIMELFW